MLQSFESRSNTETVAPRIAALREVLTTENLDGFLVPRADEHQGEYVAACSERLAWLTSFTGSAGIALVLRSTAHLFVDGRYTLQAAHQTDTEIFTIEDMVNNPPSKWLVADKAGKGRIGFDPWLHTIEQAAKLRQALKTAGGELVPVDTNPVDRIWRDRPSPPLQPATIHPIAYSGVEPRVKLEAIAARIVAAGARAFVATDPSSLAWAFNIRGSDIPRTPLVLGFALFGADGEHVLFLDRRKLSPETEKYLGKLARIREPSDLDSAIAEIASSAPMAIDKTVTAEHIRALIENSGGSVVPMADPAGLARAQKNPAEIAGARSAHLRDAIAMVRFLAWLDNQPSDELDEIGAATKLEELRRTVGEKHQMPLRDIAFETISAFGPNGAMMHYRVSNDTNRDFSPGSLYLVDSGAQYDDGTTDITRTVPIGSASEEMRERYTLVLKGLIAVSRLRFPPGTRGQDIDAVARIALWKNGLDYAHGTGHGVGSYLSVHEGPQRISRFGSVELQSGMIISNEPGYYKEGAYGIRLENLVLVTPPAAITGGDLPMHGIETLTRVPFDRRMIRADLMTGDEVAWLNDYHHSVREALLPALDGEEKSWLLKATATIGSS